VVESRLGDAFLDDDKSTPLFPFYLRNAFSCLDRLHVDYANRDSGVSVVRRCCFSEHGASGRLQEDAGNGGGADDELLREARTTSTIHWL
jgi:hypothetical protein